jgi:hypothetical protein
VPFEQKAEKATDSKNKEFVSEHLLIGKISSHFPYHLSEAKVNHLKRVICWLVLVGPFQIEFALVVRLAHDPKGHQIPVIV